LSTFRIVLSAALGLLVLSGLAFAASEALHRDRSSIATVISPVRKIVVDADAGDVNISAGLTGDVVIHRKDAWLVDRPDVHERYRDGVLEIDTDCGHLKALLRCRSDISIDAPPEVDVAIKTRSGDVSLRGLAGRADIETDSGDISTHRLEPVTVRAKTDAGDVSLDLFGQPARTEATSDAGDVDVTVPYGMYRVDATADGGGNVKVDGVLRDDLAPQAIDAVTDVGNITVRAR
jgi:hypothetical protein